MFQGEDLRITDEVMSCREKVTVDGPGSLLFGSIPVVAEAVSDGLGGMAYVYFGAFVTDDTVDEVTARAGEGIG